MMLAVRQLIDLTGRKALVTGGAGHIGLAVCETLLELGANVAILDVDAGPVRIERSNSGRNMVRAALSRSFPT